MSSKIALTVAPIAAMNTVMAIDPRLTGQGRTPGVFVLTFDGGDVPGSIPRDLRCGNGPTMSVCASGWELRARTIRGRAACATHDRAAGVFHVKLTDNPQEIGA